MKGKFPVAPKKLGRKKSVVSVPLSFFCLHGMYCYQCCYAFDCLTLYMYIPLTVECIFYLYISLLLATVLQAGHCCRI
uniref:Uncharacterized protein n=1 Tax=Rhipicephalus microplus TaxID=6941 RepID=A0A6M2DAN5_RHIMP